MVSFLIVATNASLPNNAPECPYCKISSLVDYFMEDLTTLRTLQHKYDLPVYASIEATRAKQINACEQLL